MKIADNTVVSLEYTLTLISGEVFDKADEQEPFKFMYGLGKVLPKFEEFLRGKTPGDAFNFVITAEEGYGEHVPENVIDLPRANFDEIIPGSLEIGSTLPMIDQAGGTIYGVIVEVLEEVVKMDFNHPLAGQALRFSGKVLEVRPAELIELELGKILDDEEE